MNKPTQYKMSCTFVSDGQRCNESIEMPAHDWDDMDEKATIKGWLVKRDGRTPLHRCPHHVDHIEVTMTTTTPELTAGAIDASTIRAGRTPALPTDSGERKDLPMARGGLDYFPAAWAEVARLSKVGNDKHNPGEELHHARGKSMDHADCILRHLTERGTLDDDGFLHDVKVAWRALAMLQEELERRGAPLARGARVG